jgi:chromosome segregation ATPase
MSDIPDNPRWKITHLRWRWTCSTGRVRSKRFVMADSDLTIVILRNIQTELASHRESFAAINDRFDMMDGRFDSINERFGTIDQRFDSVMQQFAHLDRRITNVEDLAIKTATAVGVDAQSSRHRAIRSDGEIAELKVRVAALETIVKGKPTL